MTARIMLCAMVAGTALVLIAAGRRDDEPNREPPAQPHELPWLSVAAAAQIFGDRGSPGPLFEGVELGGPPPSQEVRARIAEFARVNRVEIDFDVVHDELAAIRFAVTFSGCCGYEGADVLALRLARPTTGGDCLMEETWVNDWATTSDAGVHMRARIRVNRLAVRWERALTVPELLERADGLLGVEATAIETTAGDRWTEIEPGRQYLLEVPYPSLGRGFEIFGDVRNRVDLGFSLDVERGRIVEVAFSLPDLSDEAPSAATAALRSRWGRPRVGADTRIWRMSDRIVTADLNSNPRRLTIRKR